MNRKPKRIAGMLLFACCVLAGCGGGGQGHEAEAGRAAAIERGDSVYIAADDRVSLPSSRIYYTLTSHDWYARGEPLIHEGREYRPAGMPLTASLNEMTRVGEYQGVEYYSRGRDDRATVYVPVFEGYWQTFRAEAEVFDTTVSAPPPPDPDTATSR